MDLYKAVIERCPWNSDNYVLHYYRVVEEDKALIWISKRYGDKQYVTREEATVGQRRVAGRHKHIIAGVWNVFVKDEELRKLANLKEDTPVYIAEDRVRELLGE